MAYDLKISGGIIVDGSGRQGFRGDVGVSDGRVVALGAAPDAARRTIDAEGMVIAPGFIDIHTHYDAQILWDRMLTVSPWHGVTTAILGNCGFGIAPTRGEHRDLIVKTLEKVEGMSVNALRAGLGGWSFETFPQYLDLIERRGTGVNVAVYMGHTPLRLYVMGEDATERAATDDEIDAMCGLLKAGLDAGALGFATSHSVNHIGYGGKPVPSFFATPEETRRLAGVLATIKYGIVQVSSGGDVEFEHYRSFAQASGKPLNWSSLLTRRSHPEMHRDQLGRTNELRADGVPIYAQMSCRPLTLEFHFGEPFPMGRLAVFGPVMKADREGKKRLYADPAFRTAFRKVMSPGGATDGPTARLRATWPDVGISYCPENPSLEGRLLAEVARTQRTDAVDLALDLSLRSDFRCRFRISIANNDDNGIAELLRDDNTLMGLSDAGAHASQLCDACFSTHLLGYWVRERNAISLERAIEKLTSLPARVFGLADRGLLAPGRPADVVVFDPKTVGAGPLRRVSDLPAGENRLITDATGIRAVIVNGRILRENGSDAVSMEEPLPGALLRRGAAAPGT
jgi:N-acyl-D-aspartate/D-glutamate deacylase